MNRLPLAALCLGLAGAAGAQSSNQQQGNPPSSQGTGTNPAPPPSSSSPGVGPAPGQNSPVLLGHPGGGPAIPPDEEKDRRPRDTGGRIGPGSSSPSRRPAQGAGGHRPGENDGGSDRDTEPDAPVER